MIDVSVIVATYGSPEWEERGREALDGIDMLDPQPREAISLHYSDGTLAQVRNDAARTAVGNWLCFLDADDWLATDYLAAMESADIDHWNTWDPEDVRLLGVPAVSYVGETDETEPIIPAWSPSLYDINCCVIGTLIPRALFLESGGFRGDLPSLEDWELVLRLVSRAGARLVPVPDAVYCVNERAGSRNGDQSPYELIRSWYADVPPEVWANAKVRT